MLDPHYKIFIVWASVEMLKLEMEAVLKDIEVGEALEF